MHLICSMGTTPSITISALYHQQTHSRTLFPAHTTPCRRWRFPRKDNADSSPQAMVLCCETRNRIYGKVNRDPKLKGPKTGGQSHRIEMGRRGGFPLVQHNMGKFETAEISAVSEFPCKLDIKPRAFEINGSLFAS